MMSEASHPPLAEGTRAPTDPRHKEAILETLRAIVGRLLQTGPETLDVHASFLEMGADSIVLAEAVRVIEDTFLLKISIRQLFEQFTTLDALAEHIGNNSSEAQPAAPPSVRAEAARAHAQPSQPACALPAPPPQNFFAPPAPTPDAPALEAAAGEGAQADSLERVVSRQLDLLAQFSGIMSRQLDLLGHARTPARPTPTLEAREAHLPSRTAQPNPGRRRPIPTAAAGDCQRDERRRHAGCDDRHRATTCG